MNVPVVYVGLGSNLGDRRGTLCSAVRQLSAHPHFTLLRESSLYVTRALGKDAGGEFLNAVISLLWEGTPLALLDWCQSTEQALGRVRSYPDAPRTLDLDMLWWEGLSLDTPRLTLPHPRLLERAFTLVPLLEIAPHLRAGADGEALTQRLCTSLLEQGIRTAERQATPQELARV